MKQKWQGTRGKYCAFFVKKSHHIFLRLYFDDHEENNSSFQADLSFWEKELKKRIKYKSR